MRDFKFHAFFVWSVLFGLVCAVDNAAKETPNKAVSATLMTQLAAHNAEDVKQYMATIHPDSPVRQLTEEVTAQLYEKWDFRTTLDEHKVIAVEGDTAKCRFTMTTRWAAGPKDFRDNRVKGVHMFKRAGDRWLMWDTKVDEIKYLD